MTRQLRGQAPLGRRWHGAARRKQQGASADGREEPAWLVLRVPEKQRQVLREQLVDVILCVLRAHPELHCYQGYHDAAVAAVGRDFMDPTIDNTKHIPNYLMPILQRESPQLHDFMQRLSCDRNLPSVRQLLSCLPQDRPYEALIVRAHQLFQRLPHTELAKRTALHLCRSIAICSFSAFQQAALHQHPEAILHRQQRRPSHAEPNMLLLPAGRSTLLKAVVWGLTATLGAAALTVTQTALEWSPDFFSRLF